MNDFNSKMDKQFMKTEEKLDDSADRIWNTLENELNRKDESIKKYKKQSRKWLYFVFFLCVLLFIGAIINYVM